MRRQTAATAQPSGASEPSNQTDGPERNQRSPGARARLPLCRRPSHGTAREAAGLPPLPFHHLRHTFATLAIRGLDPATVQTLMGHSKITTTERYLHARPLTELAERMDAIFELAPVAEQQPTRRPAVRTLISEIVFTLAAISKLAARGISTDEVLDLPWNRYRVVPNPHGPDPERRFLIGQTNAGRVLTVVIAPTEEPTTWLVITGWEATISQRRLLDAEQ